MTPSKMLAIHQRMVELQAQLKEEFGGQVGMNITGQSGPSSFPGMPPGFEMSSCVNVTFAFRSDEPDRPALPPPAFMSSFGGRDDA